MALTAEQQRVVDAAVQSGGPLKVQAGAGCGKTYTLLALARALDGKGKGPVAYLAFNRSIADEAGRKFGTSAAVFTTHGIAFHALDIGRMTRRRKLGRIYPWQAAEALGIQYPVHGLTPVEIGSAIVLTLEQFLHSASPVVESACVPPGVQDRLGSSAALLDIITGYAQDLFFAAATDDSTRLPLPHDLYLKYWQIIGAPGLERFSAILLDEAQDSNPVILEAMKGRRVIYVGDTHQAIYSFRDAVDAMTKVEAPEVPLTQSFRFGTVVADLSNAILSRKTESRLRYPLRGLPRLNTRIAHEPPEPPCTRIYRTNYQLIRDALVLADRGRNVAIMGDMRDLAERVLSAVALAQGRTRGIKDPLIRAFDDFDGLIAASEHNDKLGKELKQIVRIVEDFGGRCPEIVDLLNRNQPRGNDTVMLTTAHKAKGQEWDNVAIMADFDQTLSADNQYDMPPARRDEELNLLYVAASRAKRKLYIGGEYLKAIARDAGLLA